MRKSGNGKRSGKRQEGLPVCSTVLRLIKGDLLANCNMLPKPPPPLRVFISYKLKDHAATNTIKKILLRIGGDRIKVFVSGDEEPGVQWRENVPQELAKASLDTKHSARRLPCIWRKAQEVWQKPRERSGLATDTDANAMASSDAEVAVEALSAP
jgi:hypothetical protein